MANSDPARQSNSPIAVMFGASGAIGSALTDAVLSQGRYGFVYAGSRTPRTDLPANARAFRFDLTDESSIIAACQEFSSPPELVIVATGILNLAASGIAPERTLRSIDAETMARVYALNAIGPALIAKHVLPILPKDRRAIFAVLSARVGSIGDNRLGGWHAYRASKAALNMLVKNFAIELARTHPMAIVAGLHPGTVDSGLSAPFQRGVAPGKLFPPELSGRYLLRVLDGLTVNDSGGQFSWDGSRLPD